MQTQRSYRIFFTKILFIFIITGIINSCSTKNDIFHKVFDKSERKTANELIKYYDDFILSKMQKDVSISEAYLMFLDKTIFDMNGYGDLSYLIPDYEEKDIFLKSLNRKDLSEFYFIQDSICVFNREKRKTENRYKPFRLMLNTEGSYFELLRQLSYKKEFFRMYYKDILVAGTISPSSWGLIFKDYHKVNFDNKEERLVLIVQFLQIQPEITHEEIDQNAP
jgi:hypothetical protein